MRWFLLLTALSFSGAFAHGPDHSHAALGTASGGKRVAASPPAVKTAAAGQAGTQKVNEAGLQNPNWLCVKTPEGKTNCLVMPGHAH